MVIHQCLSPRVWVFYTTTELREIDVFVVVVLDTCTRVRPVGGLVVVVVRRRVLGDVVVPGGSGVACPGGVNLLVVVWVPLLSTTVGA